MARQSFVVPERLAGARLDQALAALVPELSRRRARDLIALGSVYVDGHRCRVASRPVPAGTRLGLEEAPARAPGPGIPVRILWRGPGLVALDKPEGIPLLPTRAAVEGTLLHALAREMGLPLAALLPVHRLDTPTSGVALVATEKPSAAAFSEALREGRVRKTYLAWALGAPDPPEGEWTWPLSEARGGVVAPDAAGRPATTRYRLLERRAGRSLLELSPLTGRTHQLRVHCARAGCPILGDRKYGGPAAPLARRALLHAWTLRFPLREGGEQAVEAPVPDDMA